MSEHLIEAAQAAQAEVEELRGKLAEAVNDLRVAEEESSDFESQLAEVSDERDRLLLEVKAMRDVVDATKDIIRSASDKLDTL